MTCDQARELAALAASGDVTPLERSSLERHVASCAECHAEVDGFETLRGQLAGMREESVPDHAYAAVRARVIAQIRDRRRPRWVAAWAGAAALAACGMILAVALRRELPQVKPAPAQAQVETAGIREVPPPFGGPTPPLRVRRPPVRIAAQKASEPVVMQILTEDPEVVIYWIADAKGKRPEKETMQ